MTVERFEIAVADEDLGELRDRLARTRFADVPVLPDWGAGVPSEVLREWVAAWADHDWRAAEADLNRFEHYRATVDGQPIHFIHRRGTGPDPVPLILTHGWPWTFWDWHATIDALADPRAHGGDPADAFDVVVASVPGATLSTPLRVAPLGYTETAELWVKLMTEELGYGRFAAAGGDQGTLITAQLGHAHAEHLLGVHLLGVVPLDVFGDGVATPRTMDYGRVRPHTPPSDPILGAPPQLRRRAGSSHVLVHSLEPDTLGAGMEDSPAGMMAWLLHRRYWWSDNDGDVTQALSKDFLLTSFSLAWFTASFTSAIRFYHSMVNHPWHPSHDRTPIVEAPTGVTFFGQDITSQSRFWVGDYVNLIRATAHDSGGHFMPAEQPAAVVDDIRATFRELR
jgi:pimeloyl-ACP methyl ester carboxylesterase